MAHPPELVWLENQTPKSTRFDDTYYTREGGLDETRYVFIDGNALPERWQRGERPVIGELGFGTGLNFLATWQALVASLQLDELSHEDKTEGATDSHSSGEALEVTREDPSSWRVPSPTAPVTPADATPPALTFVSFEQYPMDRESLSRALSPWPDIAPLASRLLEAWQPEATGWQQHDFGAVRLHLFLGDAREGMATIREAIDAWYLDGFNPKTNPELWELELMQALRAASSPNATLASYTAAGWVRRNLQSAGFAIAKRKGFGHKRDMITGTIMPTA